MRKEELVKRLKEVDSIEKAKEILNSEDAKKVMFGFGEGLKARINKIEKSIIEFKPIKNDAYYEKRFLYEDDFIIEKDLGDFLIEILK